ncbi:OsmC family protein [Cohnella algarum]|uniref:OsmC family protein n=1 Tax=Cohnella algarum TaxID=2044859 RepID=UPI001967BD92|nr:OsmC family protein [Cohnella algarum]MBN2980900.1 OsmC family protein [Cohnella algarum]
MIEVSWTDNHYVVKDGEGVEWGTEASTSWTPIVLLECSLALCVAKSLNMAMERDGVEADRFVVTLHSAKAGSGASRIERFDLSVELPNLFESGYKEKLVRHASQICTIGNTLKRGSELSYEAE